MSANVGFRVQVDLGGERPEVRVGAAAHTDDVEHKANESMVGSQRQQYLVDENNMLKVVYDALSVEEVHGGGQPVPVETLCGAQLTSSGWDACDGDDLLEGDYLYNSDDQDDVDVAHE